jgi:hypothetical protein
MFYRSNGTMERREPNLKYCSSSLNNKMSHLLAQFPSLNDSHAVLQRENIIKVRKIIKSLNRNSVVFRLCFSAGGILTIRAS